MKRAELLAGVLRKIAPSKAEKAREIAVAGMIMEKIRNVGGSHVDVMLCGSIARDTHLKGDNDLDIFVLFPEKLSREQFEKQGLRIGKLVFRGHKWEKLFSEHPYIRGSISGYDVEIVPSYKVSRAELKQSSVDRSPFHNIFLRERLKERHKAEARLLRQFMKGIKCYGADVKASSVPGYVVELLVLHYGSFIKAVKAISEWAQGQVIDIAEYYSKKEARKLFPDVALVVIDPVDKNRNVAAALSLNQFSRMVAAARAFSKKPSNAFFFGKREKPWGIKKLQLMFGKKELVAVMVGFPKKAIPDLVWGQIQRFARKTERQLLLNDFKVVRSDAWTDEKDLIVMLFEVETRTLQKSKVTQGPFITDRKNSAAFLAAHEKRISGPRIEQGRWVIEIARKHTRMESFLKEFLKKEKSKEKMPLRNALNKSCRIIQEPDLAKLFKKNREFACFLTTYLKGEEEFLDY